MLLLDYILCTFDEVKTVARPVQLAASILYLIYVLAGASSVSRIWAPVSMEKLQRSSWKLFAFLPKMVSPVPYGSPPLSPVKPAFNKAFPSPIALVPKEARRRGRSGRFEPTSPKVSCMGQVGRKKKKKKKKKKKRLAQEQTVRVLTPKSLANMFKGRQQHVGKSTDESGPGPSAAANIPNLGSMKKYSSSRGTLEGFDWKNHGFEVKQKQVGEECKPRKETNLWKRRSFAPPTILVLSK